MIDSSINKKYQELFLSEALEHLDALDANLISFEKDIKNEQASSELMRHAHTLKGMAASMNYGEISNLAHSFEGMVENIKNGIASGDSELLFGAVDELRRLVGLVSKGQGLTKANPLVDKVGEMESDDLAQDSKIAQSPENFKNVTEIKVKTIKLNNIMDIVAELTLNKMRLINTIGKLPDLEKKFIVDAVEENTRLVDELQYQTIQLRLMPLLYVFNRFPRMIRDLAHKEKKVINFKITGGDLELDRSILDVLGEPLVHLLRNAVDHGIQEKGDITLSAVREKDKAIISLTDTGGGIDWDKLRTKAGNKITPKTSNIELLFSGISSADTITDISGRGVGMSIVKSKIESLGGKIEVISEAGKGTTFKIYLPISLAIIKVLLIEVNKQIFAVPLSNIERLIDFSILKVQTQANQEIAVINENNIPLIKLKNIFNLKEIKMQKKTKEFYNDEKITIKKLARNKKVVILIKSKESFVGFVVDNVIAQQDMVVKPLSENLREEGSFSAMTILGNGTPVPILDTESIIKKL